MASTPSAYLDPAQQALIEASRARLASTWRHGDRAAIVRRVSAVAYLAAAGVFGLLVDSHHGASLGAFVLLVGGYAVASRIQFEVGSGVVIPTELAFMPMLFVLPVGDVPMAVAAAIVLSHLPELLRRKVAFDTIAAGVGSGWFALGPAALVAALHEPAATPDHWWLLGLLIAAQTGSDFASTSIQEWLALAIRPAQLVGVMALVVSVDGVLAPIGFLGAMSGGLITLAMPLLLLWLISRFARERTAAIDGALELGRAYRGTAFLLGDVVEADDAYTGSHSRDVVELSLAVSDQLGLNLKDRQAAELVALLHDVGKIRIPNEIINKPGPLTPEERAIIETHTLEGEQLLLRVGGFLGEVGHIVRSCHEKWDGTGYPDGLTGEETPLVARIICCCDAFNAMTTDRSYRKARTLSEAAEETRRSAGTHFDPAVVDALLAVYEPELQAAATESRACLSPGRL